MNFAQIKKHPSQSTLFFFNLLLLTLISYFAFSKNQNFLFMGFDGSCILDLVRQQFKWDLKSIFGYTNNIFQSLGNIHPAINTNLIPAYFLSALINNGEVHKSITYTICAIEIFVAMYIFCYSLRFNFLCNLMSGWVFVLSTLPYIGLTAIYPIFALVPNTCSGISEVFLLMIFIKKLGEHQNNLKWLYFSGIIFLMLHISIAYPGIVILSAPLLTLFGICCVVSIISMKERLIYFATLLSIVLLFFIFGPFKYLIGLLEYTAAVFFPNDLLNDRMSYFFVSILFYGGSGIKFLNYVLVFGGIAGALLDIYIKVSSFRRNLAFTFLFYIACIFSFGYITVHYNFWRGPSPIYFEFIAWPLYAIYSTHFFIMALSGVFNVLINNNGPIKNTSLLPNIYLLILSIIVPAIFLGLLKIYNDEAPSKDRYPPTNTPIIDMLRNEIGLHPSALFRGRVATFTGLNVDSNRANWFDLHKLDNKYIETIGNEHRLIGLTHYDIPCFFEYSAYITPPFYAITRKFLSKKNDDQLRNVMMLRNIDPKILKLLGVRFLITDAEISQNVKLRYKMENPTLFLYEFEDVNIGQYSPTSLITISDGTSTLNRMAQPDFDPTKLALVHEEFSENLMPAKNTQLLVGKGFVNVSSESDGTSLLVLPLEYSHCLKFTTKQNPSVKLIRVNLLQAGILFKGKLNGNLRFFVGPLSNSSCRYLDYKEAKRMRLKEISFQE